MHKYLLPITLVAVILGAGLLFVSFSKQVDTPPPPAVNDYKNTTYTMPDGTTVTLSDGVSEKVLDNDIGALVTVRYFGNELFKDLNDDGRDDVVFILTEDRGGSGTFFYVVAALNTEAGYLGSHALLLGDRIAPQTTESGPGKQIIVNYAKRAPGEPMTAVPTVGQSERLILDLESMQFGVVAPDFAGEADPERMTLTMKTWVWQRAEYNDGRVVTPNKPNSFTVTFEATGSVAIGTDCNSVGADYRAEDGIIAFTNMRTTLMYCEGSQETEFVTLLADATTFHFTSRGELVFGLKFDSGTVIFR